jgi:hypothetical protein
VWFCGYHGEKAMRGLDEDSAAHLPKHGNLLMAMEYIQIGEELAVAVTFEMGEVPPGTLPGCEPMVCVGRVFNAAGEEIFRMREDATGMYRTAIL